MVDLKSNLMAKGEVAPAADVGDPHQEGEEEGAAPGSATGKD